MILQLLNVENYSQQKLIILIQIIIMNKTQFNQIVIYKKIKKIL